MNTNDAIDSAKKLISVLDTQRFGFNIAKISDEVDDLPGLLNVLRNLEVKLVIARIDFKNTYFINQLEQAGFLHKDGQLTFNFDLKNNIPEKESYEFLLISENYREYEDQLISLTKASFNNYGHYFLNEKLDKSKCLDIYTDWIRRCCYDKNVADNIVIAVKDGLVCGYLAMKIKQSSDEKFVAGVIGAVSPQYRKLGVFRAINIESLIWTKSMNASRLECNVLLTNYPVMKTYTNLCWQIIRSETTMHCWI